MHLYYICFLTGLAISASVYCGLHFLFPASAVNNFIRTSAPPSVLMAESREKWDNSNIPPHMVEINVEKT
jgi:hypothetical protein